MKTTLELPENLVRQAEVVAARNGLPLGVFVADEGVWLETQAPMCRSRGFNP